MSSSRLAPGSQRDARTTFAPYSAFEIPQDLRQLHGRYDVEATARRVRNLRYAEEWTMRIMGGWIATVPEIPVKTGLGKIVWETAKAADELGRRLPELRCGQRSQTTSESPNQRFADLIQAIAEPERPDLSIEKLTGVFDVLKPHLIGAYEQHNRETDAIADAPTIEIFEDIVRRNRRHVAWGAEVLERLCDTDAARERRRRRETELRVLLKQSGGVTGELGARPTTAENP